MILQYFILNVLITFATSAVVDQEPPVFSNCPSDIVVDDATTSEMRVNWQQPTVTDNSGVPPSVTSNKAPGSLFSVPGSYEIIYTATDGSGNQATCSFRITLKVKTCPMYAPPKNGALACNSIGLDSYCVVMCNDKSDFVFNPPMFYYCSDGQWNFYAIPGQSYSTQLPWPDCSNTANPSYFKTTAGFSNFFFNGDGNDPNVQATIKTNYISLMTNPYVPPFFCLLKPADCNQDTVQLYVGASTDQEPPVFTFCPSDVIVDDVTGSEIRVNWDRPTVTDNSGVEPSVTSNRHSGESFSVPGSYEVIYTATDGAGNEATCSFRITLKVKTCPMYAPPKNGALACNSIGLDIYCVVMCNDKSDFVFNPPMLYYCSDAQWRFYAIPGQPYLTQLPWPDCSNTANPSYFKTTAGFSDFFFNGDGNDPNVQATIKTNFISLMTNSNYIPPFFCLFIPDQCNQDTVELYVGASTA